MGRREKPLPRTAPLATFAGGLRALRAQKGYTYQKLSVLTRFSIAVLSEAASGTRLPTWEVTAAFVEACDGVEADWRARWEAARAKWQRHTRSPGRPARRPPADPSPVQELAGLGFRVSYGRGGVMIRQSDPAGFVLVILKGQVKVSTAASNGRQVLLTIRGPGDVLGDVAVFDGGSQPATIAALTQVDAVLVRRTDFLGYLDRNPARMRELLAAMAGQVRESGRRRLESGAYTVLSRMAMFLFDHVEGGYVAIHQSELADAIGATREATVKALRTLREHGLLRTERGRIAIPNLDVLHGLVSQDLG
jgi:CRP/FNR family transcriptional regulator, cyclic AMP receptor protein